MNTLIIIFIIIIFLRYSGRYLIPFLMKRYINNVKKKYEAQQNTTNTPRNESKINIKYPLKGKSQNDNSVEYTDFEEIKTDQKQ